MGPQPFTPKSELSNVFICHILYPSLDLYLELLFLDLNAHPRVGPLQELVHLDLVSAVPVSFENKNNQDQLMTDL